MKRTEVTTESSQQELELALHVLKDLTVPGRHAEAVKGGMTTSKPGRAEYCGSW